jgi:glycosyltransferase involved in cell wall biosynthesis
MISFCTFVKNEAHCLAHMLSSVEDFVQEIVVVDTGSTDGTQDIARCFTNRVYEIGFTDFGKVRTITAHLATQPWVLMLDADETLSHPERLVDLIKMDCEAFAIPRARWSDLMMTNQTELEAWPDLQVRFFKNNPNYVWRRELHEYFDGAAVHNLDHNYGIWINHFQDVFKDSARKTIRDDLYKKLALLAGVTVEGGFEI